MNIQNASSLLADIKSCAVKAGIYEHWFLSFGTLLGAVRPTRRHDAPAPYVQGIMEHDDDMDIGIFADRITAEQEEAYLEALREKKVFDKREAYERRSDTNRLLWFTLRREEPPTGTKCCHWLFYEWNGFMWHSKGREWLAENKFPSRKYPHQQTDEAMGKGLPAKFLMPGELMEIDFEGGRYNVPVMYGGALDHWYPYWLVPIKGGSSKTEYVMKVERWSDQRTWRIF